ncbi:MAG: protein kinase [Myxococcota bacterium]
MAEPLRAEALERIGRFRVRRYIAGGGMAWVFEVEDPGLFDARRALKLLKPGETDVETLRRFRREAELLSKLQHPNLVHIYEFGEDPGTGCQYYTMDFVEGRTLAQIHPDWLAGSPDGTPSDARSLEQICRYFLEVLSALARLHAQEIVHRDIKPQNVFIDGHGRAVLGDLGVAKLSSASGETQKGVAPGTPLYMAPEQSLRFEASTRTDIFSLGLALYRVLTGRTVYDAALGADSTNSMAVLRHLWSLQGASQEFEFDFPPQVPEALREVVRRACRMSPEQRYPSADAMAEALSAALRPARAAARSRASRGLTVVAAAALGVLVLALGFWIGLGSYGRGSSARSARSAAEAAHAQASALVGGLSSRTGPGAAEAVEDARRRIAYAGEQQTEAEKALQAADYAGAEESFARASDGYTRACQALLDRWLRAAAGAEIESARAAVASISPATPELVARAKSLPDSSADPGCAGAGAERDRLFAAESLRGDAAKRGGRVAEAPALAPVAAAPAGVGETQAAAPSAAPPARAVAARQPRDRHDDKRAIEAALEAWNRALNARDWSGLASLQKLRPGQLERYQAEFADKDVRQNLAIEFIAGFDTGKIDAQVVVTREEKTLFFWRTISKDTRRATATRENGAWKLEGL